MSPPRDLRDLASNFAPLTDTDPDDIDTLRFRAIFAAAARAALTLDRNFVRRYGESFSWAAATAQFVANLHPLPASVATAAMPVAVR